MASTAAFISGPSSLPHCRKLKKGVSFDHNKTHFFNISPLKKRSINYLFSIRKSSSSSRSTRNPTINPTKPFSPVMMEWQESKSEIEVDVPCSVAYSCYSDRELIPQWMPFISSVKNVVVWILDDPLKEYWKLMLHDVFVLKDKPDLSRWSLKYEVFGRNVEFSWLARNMQPIPNQKIHWRSLEGLPNKGAVRFFPKGPSSCKIELSVSYEIPEILTPVASALKPFLEGLLFNGLERFAKVAREYQGKISQR